MPRGLTDLLKSMTGVLQLVGFGRDSGPVVPREQEHAYEVQDRDEPELREQIHEPERPRLERGHPKR